MRVTPLKHHLLILLLTMASCGFYYTLGVRFGNGPLLQAMQLIEADLLTEDLARSLLY
jgi:hypothetical protein